MPVREHLAQLRRPGCSEQDPDVRARLRAAAPAPAQFCRGETVDAALRLQRIMSEREAEGGRGADEAGTHSVDEAADGAR